MPAAIFFKFEMVALLLLPPLLLGYLLGSMPFGLVLTNLAGLGDIRTIGSGNIGATNVLRTGNKLLALAVLMLDSGKGALAVLIAYKLTYPPDYEFAGDEFVYAWMDLAAIGAVLGHLFPVWLKFKGGKGVATTLGTLLALAWPVGLIACATWLVMALTFRLSSLAALTAMVAAPIAAYFLGGPWIAVPVLVIGALVWWKHADNIKRLLDGAEPRISFSSKMAA